MAKRRKATLHSAGRVVEADLLERARELSQDPSLATPVCEGGCVLFSPVKAAQRAIPRIHAAREDEAALQKLASKGNDLARAYAATLLLARSQKVPFVADIKFAGETIPYVIRGKAKPFFLAGLQHYDDRALRLLSVAPWSKKRRIHFFSADRGIVCTGKRFAPPSDWLAEEAEALGLAETGAVYACGHEGDAVVLHWPGGVRFERCLACAGDESTLGRVVKHMLAPGMRGALRAEPRLVPLVARAGAALTVAAAVPEETLATYLRGGMSDALLLEAARAARVGALKASGAHLVAGDESFGDDVDAFVASLHASPAEERALRAALAAHKGPVVLDRATSARALAELWPTYGRMMLEAVSDAETASRFHKEIVTPDEAVDVVRRAAREGAGRAVSAALPTYASLPPAAAAADAIARTFRAQGRDAALRMAQERAGNPKAKGVALAALTALGGGKGMDWKFTQEDREIAAAIAPHVRELLHGAPGDYDAALRAATRGAGETQDFAPR